MYFLHCFHPASSTFPTILDHGQRGRSCLHRWTRWKEKLPLYVMVRIWVCVVLWSNFYVKHSDCHWYFILSYTAPHSVVLLIRGHTLLIILTVLNDVCKYSCPLFQTSHHSVASKRSPCSKYMSHVRPCLCCRHVLVRNSKSNQFEFASLFSSPYCCRQWLWLLLSRKKLI